MPFRRNSIKRIALSINIVLCTIITGCWMQTDSSPPASSNPDLVTGYLIGSPPPGLKDVLQELNRKLMKDFHASLDLKYIAWEELATRYPMVLSSGDQADFIFASNWTYYNDEALNGAFREITEEMLGQYMPLHYRATDPKAWREASIGGKIYMIPTASPDQKVPVTLIRGDLRKKYGLPEIKRFSDLEPYLMAIKANEPGMIPIRIDKQYDFTKAQNNLQWELGPSTVDLITTTNGFSGVYADWDRPDGEILSLFQEPLKSSFIQSAKIVKKWYDNGYINRNAFANKVRSKDSFEQGTSAVAFGNSNDIQSTLARAKQKGWEVEIIPNLSAKQTYIMDPYINSGVALPSGSKNPELTMRILDRIMEDPAYSRLVYFGIEGKNYVLKEGQIDLPEGLSPDKNDYPPDASGFWFINKRANPPIAYEDAAYQQHKDEIRNMLVPYVYSSFNFNVNPVRGELNQINQAAIQYLNPILGGMVPDVDAAFAGLQAAVYKAGYDKVLDEAKLQTRQFLKSE